MMADMPFTPFHLGPALLLGLMLSKYIDLATFLFANILVDLEPLLVLSFGINLPLHGLSHSFLVGTAIAVLLTLIAIWVREPLEPLISVLNLGRKWSRKGVLVAALSGVYLHIFMDAPLYIDIRPFYPLATNPFYQEGMSLGFQIYALCVVSGLMGVALYTVRLFGYRKQIQS